MKSLILDVLHSKAFMNRLIEINVNYPNLKQEALIRNSILELLNKNLNTSNPSLKAFAEHPRDKNCRVDLAVVNKEHTTKPYLVEFKFQYTSDFKEFLDYKYFVDKDFERTICGTKTNLFILIVAHWNTSQKNLFDIQWGLTSNLSRFISLTENWKKNLKELFSSYENTDKENFSIEINEPYQTSYSFFLIDRVLDTVNDRLPAPGLNTN